MDMAEASSSSIQDTKQPPQGFKVLWFSWRDIRNPQAGGAEVFTYEVAKRLVEAGHHVTLFSSSFPGGQAREFVDGIEVIRGGGAYGVYISARWHYWRHLSKEAFDVVIDEINTVPFFAHKLAHRPRKVVALIFQLAREFWFFETRFPLNYAGRYLFEDRWLRSYAKVPVITISESSKRDLVNLGIEDVSIVSVGINFEPLDRVPEKALQPTLAFTGRLKRAKRPDHAIKAFEILKERVPDAQLWVMGDGYFRQEMERTTSKDVKFYSGMSNAERRDLIRKAWVLLCPGVREGFGLNVIEANALGVPCVAYDVPGLRDSVRNGETGILVPAGDVNAMAEAALGVVSDAELRRRLSEAALRYSRGFSWDEAAEQFANVIFRSLRS